MSVRPSAPVPGGMNGTKASGMEEASGTGTEDATPCHVGVASSVAVREALSPVSWRMG